MFKWFRQTLRRPSIQTLSSIDAYAQWAVTYPPDVHNPLMAAEQSAMNELMPDLRGKVVLDLACGTGRYGLLAQSMDAKLVIGIDNSHAMLAAAQLSPVAEGTTEALPLANDSIDVILCGLALGHLPTLSPSLREISRVLKPGGLALISDFHPFLALSGAKRTFTGTDGRTYSVEHYVHLYSDYHREAAAVGLDIEAVIERGLPVDMDTRKTKAPIVIVYHTIRR